MTKLDLNALKKELQEYNQNELIQLISDLFTLNDDVQQYLSNKFIGEEAIVDLYERTKKEITDEFFPNRGFGRLDLPAIRNAIIKFESLSGDELRTLDLMLYFVELGTEFKNTYGEIDTRNYYTFINVYKKVVTACAKNESAYNQLHKRLYSVVLDAAGTDLEYYGELKELYNSIK